MSKRKYFMTVRYKTKEDFDKDFMRTYNSGRQAGYEEGFRDALARLVYAFENEFDSKDIGEAEYAQRNLQLSRYKRRCKIEDAIKQRAIEEYIKNKETEANSNEVSCG